MILLLLIGFNVLGRIIWPVIRPIVALLLGQDIL
jgi:hypothetical protein